MTNIALVFRLRLSPLLGLGHLLQPQRQEQRLVRGIPPAELPEDLCRGQRAPRLEEGAPEAPADLLGLLPVLQPRLAHRREGVRRQHLGPRAAVVGGGLLAAHALREVHGEGVVLLLGQQEVLRVQPLERLVEVLRRHSAKGHMK